MTTALAADALVAELKELPIALHQAPLVGSEASTMGALKKVRYTHAAMVDLIIQNPWISQNEIAATFGYSVGWISNVFASDAFQAYLAQRRDEIVDPAIKATVEERTKALVIRSLEVLAAKLDRPVAQVPDTVALRCLELGARALGMGGNAPPPVPPSGADRLERLAHRLIDLQSNIRKGVTHEHPNQEASPSALSQLPAPRAATG